MPCEPGCAEYLRQRCAATGNKFLRACYPNDIYRLVKAISEYEGRAVRIKTPPDVGDDFNNVLMKRRPDARH